MGFFSGGSDGKESACNAEDPGSIPGLERSLEKGMALQYSCLENSMDRGAWKATVHEVARMRHNLATKPSLPPLGYAENMEERLIHFTILGFCLVFLT